MKEICFHIAYASDGECQLGKDCICDANEKWLTEDTEQPSPTIDKNKWDGKCICGHLHSEHGPSGSINYSAGRCAVKECPCAHFVHNQGPSTAGPFRTTDPYFTAAPTKEPAGEKPMPGNGWKEYEKLPRETKDSLFSVLEPFVFLDGESRDVVFDCDAMMAMYNYAKSQSVPVPDPGPLGDTPGDTFRKAVEFALSIRDLWAADQVGTVSADHEGEMQALSKMEELFKQATLLTPAFTGEKPMPEASLSEMFSPIAGAMNIPEASSDSGPLGRREESNNTEYRDPSEVVKFLESELSSANKRIAGLEAAAISTRSMQYILDKQKLTNDNEKSA